jgi:hypothetical protein
MDIFHRYSLEINGINNLLIDLENGRIYEIDKVPGVASSHKLAKDIEQRFIDLLIKIQDNEDSISEVAAKAIKLRK